MMNMNMKSYLIISFWFNVLLLCITNVESQAMNYDILLPGQQFLSYDVLHSPNMRFNLSFFTTNPDNNYYLNIVGKMLTLWVANRDSPIKGTSGVLNISEAGYLTLYEDNQPLIIINQDQPATGSNITLSLTDAGNLVLRTEEQIVWQSIDQPTDVILPGMQIGLIDQQPKRVIRSWLSDYFPTTGAYSLSVDPNNTKQMVIWQRGKPFWRSGTWDGKHFPYMDGNFNYVSNENGSFFVFLGIDGFDCPSIILTSDGNLVYFGCDKRQDSHDFCDETLYLNYTLWDHYPPGCVKPEPSSCQEANEFGLVQVPMNINLSSFSLDNYSLSVSDCKELCRKNCSCIGFLTNYYYVTCTFFPAENHNLLSSTIEQYHEGDNKRALYVRRNILPEKVTLQPKRRKRNIRKALLIGGSTIAAAAAAFFLVFMSSYLLRKRKHSFQGELHDADDDEAVMKELHAIVDGDSGRNKKNQELPFFKFSTIKNATNNFSQENFLGRGGFGLVYKGTLDNRREIAVKRLSRESKQGLKEFKTEVILISKLQHRNLVRLLGCCIHDEERILVYEYLQNKSLDDFLFETDKKHLLDWKTRFNVIQGIAQGLLYLHKYSRLKIIHRDLKASNVLLDGNMIPKISDFGTARIFKEDEFEAETRRIVGTYGYMSPEYAIEGLFSEKSDVFSFGVIVLEIVTGKKSNSTHSSKILLGYAWDLWKERRALEMIEPALGQVYSANEILRCVQIGLLCAQETAVDRPTMTDVVSMLSNELVTLSNPNEPTFLKLISSSDEVKPLESGLSDSANLVTVSDIEAR